MKVALHLVTCFAVIICTAGCGQTTKYTVKQYGPEYMTYTGPNQPFDDACRKVLHDLSYKEKLDGNRTRYPDYGEGVSSHNEKDRRIAAEKYLKTKDEDGAEYKITTLSLGKLDPIVILESASSDRHKLVNALNAEFHRNGIEVRQY